MILLAILVGSAALGLLAVLIASWVDDYIDIDL